MATFSARQGKNCQIFIGCDMLVICYDVNERLQEKF